MMGGWLWSVYELQEHEKREFELKARLVVRHRLEAGLAVDADTIIADVRDMQRLQMAGSKRD